MKQRGRRSHAEGDPVELFAERVADYRATVLRSTPEALADTIRTMLTSRGAQQVVVPPGFPTRWLPAGSFSRDEPPLSVAQLDALYGAVTTAAAAIAVTGTIVLDAGPGQGRRALSLVPDYHLCVVRASQILGDVPDAPGWRSSR